MESRFEYLNNDPELASDLEWMLQSGQAPVPALAEALVNACYEPVYRLAQAALDDPQAARRALPHLFATALQNLYRYPAIGSLNAWLYPAVTARLERLLARQKREPPFFRSSRRQGTAEARSPAEAALWACVDQLPFPARWMLLYTQLLGWSEAQAARALGLEAAEAARAASQGRARCEAAQIWEAARTWGTGEEAAARHPEGWLAQSLQRRWPAPEPLNEEQRLALAEAIARQVDRSTRGSQRISLAREVATLVVVVGVVGALLYGANQLYPVQAPGLIPIHTTRPTATRAPTPTPTREFYTDQAPQGVFYTVLPGDTWEQAALRIGTTTTELLRLNRIPPGAQPIIGQRLLIPGRLTPGAVSAERNALLMPTPQPPLAAGATFTEAISHLENFHIAGAAWWFDVRIQLYGLPRLNAPPAAYRFQMWMDRRLQQLGVITGREGELPGLVMIGFYGLVAHPGEGRPWFQTLPDNDLQEANLLAFRMYSYLISYNLPYPASCWENQGEEQWRLFSTIHFVCQTRNGQEEDHLWLDRNSGFPVWRQYYVEGMLSLEVEFDHLEAGETYPHEMFDPWLPWRGGFAVNAAGDPRPADWLPPQPRFTPQPTLAAQAPPAGFEPRDHALTLQFTEPPDWMKPNGYLDGQAAQLFAGPYLLAEANFPEPYSLVCERSQNGAVLVFGQYDLFGFYEGNHFHRLRWINLLAPEVVHETVGKLQMSEFAVSPDGRSLAIIHLPNDHRNYVTVLDLATGKPQEPYQQEQFALPANLAWSPDGKYLAYTHTVRVSADQSTVHLRVYAVDSGEQIYTAEVAQSSAEEFSIPPDAPVLSWGILYPPQPRLRRLCNP